MALQDNIAMLPETEHQIWRKKYFSLNCSCEADYTSAEIHESTQASTSSEVMDVLSTPKSSDDLYAI
jgi:hypothetical protein